MRLWLRGPTRIVPDTSRRPPDLPGPRLIRRVPEPILDARANDWYNLQS